MNDEDELKEITTVTDRLAASHPDLDRGSIDAAVREAYQGFAGSSVRDFVPLLVERDAAQRLGLRDAPGPE